MIELLLRIIIELIELVTAWSNMAAAREKNKKYKRIKGRKTRRNGNGCNRKRRS